VKPNLMCDIVQVANGVNAPAGTALDYHREALAFAMRDAEPGEFPELALARRIVERSAVIDTIYRAAERAAQAEGNDQ